MLVEPNEFSNLLVWIVNRQTLAVDCETTGVRPYHGDLIAGVSLADRTRGFYVPFRHKIGHNFSQPHLDLLMRALSQVPRLIFFNGSFDLHFLRLAGLAPRQPGSVEDAQVASHLYNENFHVVKLGLNSGGLKELATHYLGPGVAKDEQGLRDLIQERFGRRAAIKKEWKAKIWECSGAEVEPYATADAVLTYQLRDHFAPRLAQENQASLYRETCDLMICLQEMEMRGLHVDRQLCAALERQTAKDAEAIARAFRSHPRVNNPDFNMNSAPQLHDLFGTNSVTAALCKQWVADGSDEADLAEALLAYRMANKMNTSYFGAYMPILDKDDLLHASFSVTGTETGRLSCRSPALQAIPRDVDNHKVKLVFTPREQGGWLIEMDYHQAEVYLASFYGREKTMAALLATGEDIHTATARAIGCDRSTAKRINFSAIYGIGPTKYSRTYDVPYEESAINLARWHALYPGFRRLMNEAENRAMPKRQLALPNGRHRHYYLVSGAVQDPQRLGFLRAVDRGLEWETHKASSNLVQGMVAAVIYRAMLRLWQELPSLPMVLQVHDSLLFELPSGVSKAEARELTIHAKRIMENPSPEDPAFQFAGVSGHPDCALVVEGKWGQDRWGTLEDFHE